jgi:RNA polymerase sigma factor (TIGR02999 family)
MSEVTQILSAIESGDPLAINQLLPLVYEELRQLAAAKMAKEKPGQTLNATALVHEAYLRLIGSANPAGFENRKHFFAAAAEAMHRILIENARRKGRLKRGGDRVRLELLDATDSLSDDPDLILSVDELLQRLEREDSIAAKIARMHLFGGLSVEESGEVFGISRPVAYRNWKYARAWLREALEK